MKKIAFIFTTLFILPMVTFAAGPQLTPLYDFITSVMGLVRFAVPLLISLGVVAFFWGLVQYIFAGAKGAAAGKNIMVWGLIALFVMVSVWGIITMAQNALGVGGSNPPEWPVVPGVRFNN
jgi:hypothetical protein